MRAIKIVVFIVVMYAAAAWGGEIEEPTLQGVYFSDYIEFPTDVPVPEILSILRECLEYIEDGSIDQGRALQAAIYRPLTRDGVAQDEADRAQYEADRYRRETALHGKIKEMIKKLEGSK